ncbi:MAG: AAA family ATPase [Solirubrobacteraceae bacterium]
MSIVGRELELASLREPLLGASGVSGLVLVGEAGIGKTTLWEEGIAAARARGVCVVSARPSESEARLPFSGLIDLCEGLGSAELGALPTPQRRALEAALLRTDPSDESHPGAVEFGFVTAIRGLAARTPVVIAIDDLHWLDGPSADVLAFAGRRLAERKVGFLLARRPGRATELERSLERGSLVTLEVGALTLGAVRRMLGERLGLTLPRPLLRRVVDVTQGNPLFALEIGRSLLAQAAPAGDHQVPLPDSVEEMLGGRIADLPAGVRTALLATALSEDLRLEALAAVVGSDAVEDALRASVLLVDDDRVRAAHPLLAAVARKQSRIRERRELHRLLADAVDEAPLRALHLALGSTGANEQLAARLAAAAREASARGSRLQAVQLADHALRMTPVADYARDDRVLALAACLYEAGELRRLTELLSRELESLSAGAPRARARLLLAEGAGSRSLDELDGHLELALAECGDDDAGLRAYVLAKRAANAAAGRVAQMSDAEAWALEALSAADQREVERVALYAVAWTRSLTGRPVDELCARSRVDADAGAYLAACPERVAAQRLVWRGELPQARKALDRLLTLADERGEEASYVLMHLHLCELELRAGDWDAASSLLDEWAESWDRELTFRPQYERCRALLAAGRGAVEDAQRWASNAISRAQHTGCRWDELEARRARGIVALRAGAPEQAADDLGFVWKHAQREGVLEPGAFPVAPELVEALVDAGESDEARAVTDRLARLAKRQEHPWALANVKRCRAMLRPRAEQRASTLRAAAGNLERLGLRFDAARSLLALGRSQRRAKQWRSARDALAAAEEAFDRVGSPGWAELARAERERVGGRRPGNSGALTPTEQRVVELAGNGLANKQIASTLFVTVHTVEVHLAHAYAKLGVRSRAQLAARLAGQAKPPEVARHRHLRIDAS